MPLFAISSDQGQPLGIFDAEDEREAIRLMNADAGEADLDRDDGLMLEQVEVETHERGCQCAACHPSCLDCGHPDGDGHDHCPAWCDDLGCAQCFDARSR